MSQLFDRTSIIPTLLLLCSLIGRSNAHDHHASTNPSGSLDTMILIHIGIQFLVWCIMFPIGLIFGFSRARWHVPLQATGFLLTIGGYVLGHKHHGRTFQGSLHGLLATVIIAPIASQITLGTYLKLHINEGTRFRKSMLFAHRVVGLSYPPLGWAQVLFGMLVLTNICPVKDDTSLIEAAQCAEPFLTGTFIIQYGLYSYLFHLILPRWKGQSPETWDGLILCLLGIFYATFKHWRFDVMWIGLLWLLGGGVLSLVLSRSGRRTIMPSIVIIAIGCMELFRSWKNTNGVMSPSFGALLVLSGILRALEIMLTVKRKVTTHKRTGSRAADGSNWSAAVSISLLSAGLVRVTSSDELLLYTGIGAINSLSYLAFMFGLSIALGGYVLFLGHLFHTSGKNASGVSERPHGDEQGGKFVVDDSDDEETSLRPGQEAYELEGPSRTVDSDDEIR